MPAPAVAAAALKSARTVRRTRNRQRVLTAAGGGLAASLAVVTVVFVVAIGGTRDPEHLTAGQGPVGDIPTEPLAAYRDAGQRWQVDWAILAAIGKVECDHGRAQLPGCNPPDTINTAGARGYMQFIGSTWRIGVGQHELEPRTSPPAPDGQGYATDGNGDGHADPWSWPDAAHAAARYLTANDVASDPEGAIWQYNHDDTYVARVLERAATYRTTTGASSDIELVTVDGITVNALVAPQLAGLLHAAAGDGHRLGGGGYRDTAAQIALRRAHCGTSHYATYQMPPSACSPPTARPGESLHEQGLAVDFTCNGTLITSRSGPCHQWLAVNAAAFGLYPLASEPWHWSWRT